MNFNKVILFGLLIACINLPTLANAYLDKPQNESEALKLFGALRANYHEKDYNQPIPDQSIKFDAAILGIGYETTDWFGKLEYRCYQFDTLCDFSTLVYGYAGYHLNKTDYISAGLQPIPFGPGRFWDSSFYASINNTIGLQDIHNLGINYHLVLPFTTEIDLAYYLTDGGNYKGSTKDASRYTANLISSDDPVNTDLEENNMWIARINQKLNFSDSTDFSISMGASYWYSDIKNNKNAMQGSRNAWALFSQANYKDLNITLTGGKLSIKNKDDLNPDYSTFGSFDGEYDIANQGYFYTLDTRYTFKDKVKSLDISPYFVYSGYKKNDKDFNDSLRNIIGVAWHYKNTALYTEYVMSKNDAFVGGNKSSFAIGKDDQWNKLINVSFIYSF